MNAGDPPAHGSSGGAGGGRSRFPARGPVLVGAAVLVAFLVGFGWQFLEARGARSERDALRRELAFQELATTLASAVIQVEYGSFEGARELTSRFFTGLQEHLEDAPPEARDELAGILGRRDAIITSLSRSEARSRTEVARLFVRYQTVFGGPDRGLPLPRLQSDTGALGAPGAPGAPADTGDTGGPGSR